MWVNARAEQFSNGVTIISLYLNPLPGANAPPIEHSIFQVMKEASLLYCLPDNPFFYAGKGPSGDHAVQEATYACEYRVPHLPPRRLPFHKHDIR